MQGIQLGVESQVIGQEGDRIGRVTDKTAAMSLHPLSPRDGPRNESQVIPKLEELAATRNAAIKARNVSARLFRSALFATQGSALSGRPAKPKNGTSTNKGPGLEEPESQGRKELARETPEDSHISVELNQTGSHESRQQENYVSSSISVGPNLPKYSCELIKGHTMNGGQAFNAVTEEKTSYAVTEVQTSDAVTERRLDCHSLDQVDVHTTVYAIDVTSKETNDRKAPIAASPTAAHEKIQERNPVLFLTASHQQQLLEEDVIPKMDVDNELGTPLSEANRVLGVEGSVHASTSTSSILKKEFVLDTVLQPFSEEANKMNEYHRNMSIDDFREALCPKTDDGPSEIKVHEPSGASFEESLDVSPSPTIKSSSTIASKLSNLTMPVGNHGFEYEAQNSELVSESSSSKDVEPSKGCPELLYNNKGKVKSIPPSTSSEPSSTFSEGQVLKVRGYQDEGQKYLEVPQEFGKVSMEAPRELAEVSMLSSKETKGAELERFSNPIQNQFVCGNTDFINGSASSALGESVSDDEWENCWEQGLKDLRPAAELMAAAAESKANRKSSKQPQSQGDDGGAPKGSQSQVDGATSKGGSTESVAQLLPEPLGHVVEVYGLNSAVKTEHLEWFLTAWWPECGGDMGKIMPIIRWVDDNHALFICPDITSAQALIDLDQEKFLLRAHEHASISSREYPVIELLPARERPKTTTAVALRFIGHALGRNLRNKDAEAQLSQERQLARNTKKAREEARDEAWGK